ncbi:MAG TPA: penicillin-binding protein 2 [Verrucomicrobiae bacterium]|jgi:penicillin-binding protein 2|nr:penicillin-binding protein 2 [Verrucomicrobiae bacterium]
MFSRDDKVSPIRLTAAQYIILGIFLVLAYGLWKLQVMESGYYASAAEKNRIRNVPILAPRGKILDREGRTIVDNYPSFSALLLRDSSRDLNADADLIAQGLHLDANEVRTRIRHFAAIPQYQPIFLKEDITPDELAFVDAHRNELPELDTIMAHRRLYPRNGFMAHLIGYVGEVTEDMLNQPQFELYNPGDVVGVSGVERQYNNLLMGTNGARRALVNSHGREVGLLGETDAIPGKQLKLTLDIDLQIAAEEALEGKNGAIVAMDPRTGEILAMVSRPTFDPNDFAVRVSRDQWSKLVNDEDHPLLNKAIQAQLAPGSTFKIIMATAGLQEGIAQDLRVNCSGGAEFYGRYFKCWIAEKHRVHGIVDITKGIYQSCDVFFYTLAEKLGIERIAKYATMLGLGQKTGIDLPQEVSGIMPSEEWKIHNFKQKWFAGETISVGIGQGAVAVTPIQLARAISGIASGGMLVRPHVAFPDELPPNMTQASNASDKVQIPLDPKNWQTITDAMADVTSPLVVDANGGTWSGTAGAAHLQGIDFAGKTGTAQTISGAAKAKIANGKARFKNNAWFVGVSPRRNPEIVVCVLWESGEEGPLAAIVASHVIKAYVEKERRNPPKLAEKPKTDGKVEIGGVWTLPDPDGDEQKLKAGHFFVDLAKRPMAVATAAPGVQ